MIDFSNWIIVCLFHHYLLNFVLYSFNIGPAFGKISPNLSLFFISPDKDKEVEEVEEVQRKKGGGGRGAEEKEEEVAGMEQIN